MAPICVALGALSYPLYVVRPPIWLAVMRFNNWQGNVFLLGNALWSGVGFVTVLCMLSWWLDRYVDFPVRRRLSRALLRRSTHAADPAA